MPVWLAVLLAVGVPLLVAAVTTPLVLHVLARPKVRIDGDPAAFWALLPDSKPRWIYCVVDVSLVNSGNEETHITRVNFRLDASGEGPRFECQSLSELPNNARIDRNGGRLKGRIVYRLEKPPAQRPKPHASEWEYFHSHTAYIGKLTVFPDQHRRLLLWGRDSVAKHLWVEGVNEDKMLAWLSAEGIDEPQA